MTDDVLQMIDDVRPFIEAINGLRALLRREGWCEQQDQELVVFMLRQAAATAAAAEETP